MVLSIGIVITCFVAIGWVTLYKALKSGNNPPDKTDYQINVKNDTLTVYDNTRFVGKCTYPWLNNLIINDNK